MNSAPMIRIITMVTLLTVVAILYLRTDVYGEVEMAEYFRSSGKIYAVIAVLLVIFAGIIIFLIRMERKISKIEKSVKEKETSHGK